MSTVVRTGAHTSAGRRTSNQDAILVEALPDGRELVAIADGMGGHQAGAVASRRALDEMASRVKAGALLRDAVIAANGTLYAEAARDRALAGMGTTLVALMRWGNSYEIANVGDSRAYRIAGGRMAQITTDHSLIAEAAAAAGGLSEEEVMRSPWRNALTRALGTDPDVEVDIFGPFDAVADGEGVLLCSDGFYRSVPAETVLRFLLDTTDLDYAAELLCDEAYRRGSTDNIGVALVLFGDSWRIGAPQRAAARAAMTVPAHAGSTQEPDRSTQGPDRSALGPDRSTLEPDRSTHEPDRSTQGPDRSTPRRRRHRRRGPARVTRLEIGFALVLVLLVFGLVAALALSM